MVTCTLEEKQTHLVCTSKQKIFIQPNCISDGWKSDLLGWDKDVLLLMYVCEIISSLVKGDHLLFASWRSIQGIGAAVECQNWASQALEQFRFMHRFCGTGFFFQTSVSLQKSKGFFDLSKLYLYVTCFQKEKESYKVHCQMWKSGCTKY